MPSRLADLAWPDLSAGRFILVVPIGSTEQHGPHLPLGTDTAVAVAVARRAVALTDGAGPVAGAGTVVLGPVLPYGASGEHEGFPGTVSIGTTALEHVLVELGRSAGRWAERILLVNGHGGNVRPLADAVRALRAEGRDVAWYPCAFRGADAHAGRAETSVMHTLEPAAVRPERAEPGNTAPIADLMGALRAGGVASVAPSGILGDPTGATAAEGERLLGELAARLGAALARWAPDPTGRLR